MSGVVSEILGCLTTARAQFPLQAFTLNMTSLTDIFMSVTGSGQDSRSPEDGEAEVGAPVSPTPSQPSSPPPQPAVYIDPNSYQQT